MSKGINAQLATTAKLANITPNQLKVWRKVLGPGVTQILLNMLVVNDSFDDTKRIKLTLIDDWLKALIIKLLTENRDRIANWVETGESAIFDVLVTIVSGRSRMLAELLKRFKESLLNDTDAVTLAVIDRLIELLQPA